MGVRYFITAEATDCSNMPCRVAVLGHTILFCSAITVSSRSKQNDFQLTAVCTARTILGLDEHKITQTIDGRSHMLGCSYRTSNL